MLAPLTTVIYRELGFPDELGRGLFCLSSSLGTMTHGYEQVQRSGRNKGPTPTHYRWNYEVEGSFSSSKKKPDLGE